MAHLPAIETHLDRSLRAPASFCCLRRAWIWIIWIPSTISIAPIQLWWFGFLLLPASSAALCGRWWSLLSARWAPAHRPVSSPGLPLLWDKLVHHRPWPRAVVLWQCWLSAFRFSLGARSLVSKQSVSCASGHLAASSSVEELRVLYWQFAVIKCALPVLCDGCLLFLSVAKITDLLKANRSSAKDTTYRGFSGHLRGCIACRDASMGSETRRRCWWTSGSFLLGVMQAEMQEFMFMHKALPVFGFYCHSASTFCSFWGKKEISQVEIHSYSELMIVRTEHLLGIK